MPLYGEPYDLEDNPREGFFAAVRHNQQNLALQYLAVIINDYEARLAALEPERDEAKTSVTTAQAEPAEKAEETEKPAATKKSTARTKKKTAEAESK